MIIVLLINNNIDIKFGGLNKSLNYEVVRTSITGNNS